MSVLKNGYEYLTSNYGNRTYTINGKVVSDFHIGIDIISKKYGTDYIIAFDKGTVDFVGKSGSYGNMVLINHGNGIKTRYAHLKNISVVIGQKISKGKVLGYMGATGNVTGPHLHFEVIINGKTVNPYDYVFNGKLLPKPEPKPIIPFEGVSDEELARRVWTGEFGNGDVREKALGSRYRAVQDLVDRGYGKPAPAPAPTGFKKGEQVVPTRLVSYTGARLVQHDKQYTVYEDSRNDRVVLAAPRYGKLVIWAALNTKNVRRI